jgi:Zn-dependent peptidase ImmA (M78 family)
MRNLSLSRVREVLPEFNEREYTEEHFWKLAKRFKIVVRFMPLVVDGYYEQRRGRHYIVVDSRLNGYKRVHTLWHEFCHYLLDVPQGQTALYRKSCGDADDPREAFADAFALICMLPMTTLLTLRGDELTDDLAGLIVARRAALMDFGE